MKKDNKEQQNKRGFKLFQAIMNDDARGIDELAVGANLNCILNSHIVTIPPDYREHRNSDSYHSFSPLSYALYYSRDRAFQQLLSLGAYLNYQPERGETTYQHVFLSPVHALIEIRDWQKLESLLNDGLNVNLLDNRGRNALHGRINQVPLKIIDLLVEHGLDLDNQTPKGETVIFEAVELNNTVAARHLIERGATIDHVVNNGDTALIHALTFEKDDVVRLLIDKGADINKANFKGNRAIDLILDNGHLELLRFVTGRNIAIDINGDGNGALHEAILSLSAADKSSSEYKKKLVDCVEHLIDCGFDVNLKNKDGMTPLMLMPLRKEYAPIFDKAIANGFDFLAKNNDGETIFDIASKTRSKFMQAYLENAGLERAIEGNNDDQMVMGF